MPSMFTKLSVNVEASATSRKILNGVEYLVGPAVVAKEGVMNRVMYSAYELQRALRTCDGRPVVLNHPYDDNGNPITANSSTVLDKQGIGLLFGSTYGSDKKLRTEVWIRMSEIAAERIKGIDKEGKITNPNGVLELSTGFYHQVFKYGGEFEGVPYDVEAYDCVLDHLAILPDVMGAFSVKEGAGFPRWNEDQEKKGRCTKITDFVTSEKGTLVDIGDDFFVYSVNDTLYKCGHRKDAETDVLLVCNEKPAQVNRITSYVRSAMPQTPETPTPVTIDTFDDATVTASFNKRTNDTAFMAMVATRLPWFNAAKELFDRFRKETTDKILAAPGNKFTADELSALSVNALEKIAVIGVTAKPAEKPAEQLTPAQIAANADSPIFTLNAALLGGKTPTELSKGAGAPLPE